MAKAVLIQSPSTEEQLTDTRECDARSAILRGFADYLGDLVFGWEGQSYQFRNSLFNWAEPEDQAEYPSAICWTEEDARYGEARLSPSDLAPVAKDTYVVATCEMEQNFKVTVWATSDAERDILAMMLQDAACPTLWMYGVRLALPFYHGAHAEYSVQAINYADSEDEARHRFRKITLDVRGNLVVYRAAYNINGQRRIPQTQVQTVLELQKAAYRTGLAYPAEVEVEAD